MRPILIVSNGRNRKTVTIKIDELEKLINRAYDSGFEDGLNSMTPVYPSFPETSGTPAPPSPFESVFTCKCEDGNVEVKYE